MLLYPLSTNVGIIVISITALGYVSNWINGQFLNYDLIHFLYYIGALVHELSHAVLCLLTGAKITEFKVFTSQPHVTHTQSKISVIGGVLISTAPILGGLLFLYLINKFLLSTYFVMPDFSGWQYLPGDILNILLQINLSFWQVWVIILLLLNIGATISPSVRDLKNVWPVLILLLFVHSQFLARLGFLAITLILTNIAIQIILAVLLTVIKQDKTTRHA